MSLPVVQHAASSGRSTEESLGQLVDARELDLSSLQRGYLRTRWLEQVARLEREARRARRKHHALRVVTFVGCLLILTLVSLEGDARFGPGWNVGAHAATILLSLLVSASVALEFIFDFGARWRQSERRQERLQAEGWRFLQLSGHYRHYEDHASAFTAFANQVEELSQREVEIYTSAVTRERRRGGAAEQEAEPPKKSAPPEARQPPAAATATTPLPAPSRQSTLARGAGQTRM